MDNDTVFYIPANAVLTGHGWAVSGPLIRGWQPGFKVTIPHAAKTHPAPVDVAAASAPPAQPEG